jgi:filamentous hemagglutinin family protein
MQNIRARLLTSTACCIGLALASLPKSGLANPTDGVVVAGQATIDRSLPEVVRINQSSDKAVIDWRSFNIAPNELTQFNQPGTTSITLNRITGGDPSAILGAIRANGQVWLINPNGIAFGKSAKVDVAGLLATTLNITNDDFMAGRYRFTATGASPASVTNAGEITIRSAGLAALVAPTVANSGVIQARLGHIALASTNGFTLDFYGDGAFNFLLNNDTSAALAAATGSSAVSNSGSLIADGGSVLLTADTAKSVVDQTINMSGYIQARTVGTSKGVITLDGGDAGKVNIAGTVDASGETGGNITVTGGAVSLASTANLNASGDFGGGTVLVGGDTHGAGTVRTAQTTSVAGGALIQVNALQTGDAGKAVVWSNDRTDFAGTIDATGGALGGNGGFAEVSGHNLLNFTGTVDLRAANGEQGTLLLDPRNVTIAATGTTPTLPASGPITLNPASDDSILQVSTLLSALALGNVIVTTGSDGTQAGDITIAANVSWINGSNLTLSANHNVIVNDGVTIANTGAGNLNLHADSTGSGTGTVTFNGSGKVDYSGSTGAVSIFYNPSGGFTAPTSFASNVTTNGTVTNQLIAYMLVNSLTSLHSIYQNLTGFYALGTDINAGSDNNFKPIGSEPNSNDFNGIFDGNNHTISNLTINATATGIFHYGEELGLFQFVGINGVVRNLKMINVNITASDGVGGSLGAIAGNSEGLIENVSVSGILTSHGPNILTGGVKSSGFVGGVQGTGGGSIAHSISSATVTGDTVGGLAGGAGPISDSSASGNVIGFTAGGLVGVLINTAGRTAGIIRSSTSGAVSMPEYADNNMIGGLAGSAGYISQSFSTGSVTVAPRSDSNNVYHLQMGGLVGNNWGVIEDSYSTGAVMGPDFRGPFDFSNYYVGGLIGFDGHLLGNTAAIVKSSYSAGSIRDVVAGGLIGGYGPRNGDSVTVSYWDINASGHSTSEGGAGAVGMSTATLKNALPTGFDPAIWAIDPAVNDGYPYLKWQTANANVAAPQNVAFGVVAPPPPPPRPRRRHLLLHHRLQA